MNEIIPGGLSLAELGWNDHFQSAHLEQQQRGLSPVRVTAVHRDALDVLGADFAGRIPQAHGPEGEDRATAGDWIALDLATLKYAAIYPRTSLFKRRSAGHTSRVQLIAANVDTVFIVTSANLDFNIARLERYLAMAHEAGILPVVVITKADLVDDAQSFIDQALTIDPALIAITVNARDPDVAERLKPWLGRGQTIALMGSSGVGKSTIVNSLMQNIVQGTQGIREDDARGRHTTSGRSLHLMPSGAWLMDTPGMREIQVVDVADGINTVFDDVTGLIAQCRFSNCHHQSEPGCAVREAIETGTLDPARLQRFEKLKREERYNSEELHVAHARNKAFGKMTRKVGDHKTKHMKDW
jgi:ribosome biogenesis GTPase / thiamine phosphate phosphatase